MKNHNYFAYITTNPARSVVDVGMTNDLTSRLIQHYENRGNPRTWAGKYYCYNLVWWERHSFVNHAFEREKEIKKWRREKKNKLIESMNPNWEFLNDKIGAWDSLKFPPKN
ncbi:GIY-YIG nuclease family protein [Ekhidna sp.]